MPRNWRDELIAQEVFETEMGLDKTNPIQYIPESERIDLFCIHCQYHTAWMKAPDWITCGWCFEFIGNGADKRIAEAKQYKATREPLLKEINELLKGKDLNQRLSSFVQKYEARDSIPYGNWDSLPDTALTTLLNSLKSLS